MDRGYQVGESIMLDIAFGIGAETPELNYFQKEAIKQWTKDNKIMSPKLPKEFLNKWKAFWKEDFKAYIILINLADLSDSLYMDNYEEAKEKVKKLNFSQAYEKVLANARDYNLEPDKSLSDHDNFIELSLKTRIKDHQIAGLDLEKNSLFLNNNYHQFSKLITILADGDNHVKFWALIDQYYYNILKPWRETRISAINIYKEQTIKKVGGIKSDSSSPNLDWLNNQHPLKIYEQLNKLIINKNLKVFFWIDPFNYVSALSLRHGQLIVSCNNHFISQEELNNEIDQLTIGLKAISDPTRLKILRLIRYFSMDNTQMADYLDISRPTVSNHTKILREANLIDSKTEGRSTKHFVNGDNINQLIAHLSVFLDIL
ncbi:MAG: ArsR/SmtB family transcription factor [Clostridia bacterium]